MTRIHRTPILVRLLIMLFVLGLVPACQASPQLKIQDQALSLEEVPPGMTQAEAESLSSLDQIDPYPLYKMVLLDDYDSDRTETIIYRDVAIREPSWGCSLFAVLGDPGNLLFGRNFDWDFSPALLLFMDPPGGYASVSMVDIAYLGYGGDYAFGLTDLPLADRAGLLDAPYLPFDGMNEAGLVVGMAAVPAGGMVDDPDKETIDSLMVIRKMLDGAGTVDEAVEIISRYNIDMGSGPPLHYLVTDKSGRSVLVEFYKGEVRVIPNTGPWHQATNFLVSEDRDDSDGYCWRYGLISERLSEENGILDRKEAMKLLENVAQESTQWSVIYSVNTGEVDIVMGGDFGLVHTLELSH